MLLVNLGRLKDIMKKWEQQNLVHRAPYIIFPNNSAVHSLVILDKIIIKHRNNIKPNYCKLVLLNN